MTRPTSHPASPWAKDPSLDTRLRELWAQGLSHSKVAAELGHGLTRSAIAGRIMRLGITRAWILNYANMVDSAKGAKAVQNVKNEAANESRKIASKARMAGNGQVNGIKFGVPRENVAVAPRAPVRADHDRVPVDLMALGPCSCRWPLSVGPGWGRVVGFCGEAKDEGSPYCGAHRARAVTVRAA